MPRACLASIKKNLIVLIISVPLHLKQLLALPTFLTAWASGFLRTDIKEVNNVLKEVEVQVLYFQK